MMRKLLVLLLCACFITGSANAASLNLDNAKTFARIGDWENGIKFLEAHILNFPEDAEARLLLAECYFNWPDRRTLGERTVDKNLDRGRAQIRILGNLDSEGFQMLLNGIRSDTSRVSRECFRLLQEKKDRRAINELIRYAEEKPSTEPNVIDTLVAIEMGREKPDARVVEFLVLMIEKEGDRYVHDISSRAARGLSGLGVRDTAPNVARSLERAISRMPQLSSEDRELAVDALVGFVDSLVPLSQDKADKQVRDALAQMDRHTQVEFFSDVQRGISSGRLHPDTVACLTQVALDMVKEDPSFWEISNGRHFYMIDYLREAANRNPDILLRPETKSQLYELYQSPRMEVRRGIVEILGRIHDEEALPMLLPKLKATWAESGSMLPDGQGVSSRSPRFLWGNKEPQSIWRAVRSIGSVQTIEFLLEKLESEDMAWVFTSARLLADLRDGRAIDPLKKRYTELADEENPLSKVVRPTIAEAYKYLSGKSIEESGNNTL